MSTIFQLSCEQLYELCQTLGISISADDPKSRDLDHLRSKVTEYLLLHNLTTLHRFQTLSSLDSETSSTWQIPEDCQSCKQFKNRHKYTPPDPELLLSDEEILEKLEKKAKRNRRKFRYYPSAFACVSACTQIFLNCIPCCRK